MSSVINVGGGVILCRVYNSNVVRVLSVHCLIVDTHLD